MTSSESPKAKLEGAEPNEFEAVKKRLEEIVHAVDDDDLPLDDALDLYEEAVKLGLKASSLLEVGIEPTADGEPAPDGADEVQTPAPASDGSTLDQG